MSFAFARDVTGGHDSGPDDAALPWQTAEISNNVRGLPGSSLVIPAFEGWQWE